MTLLYLSDERTTAIIIDHEKRTFKYYEDCEIPPQDYIEIDYPLENVSTEEVKDLLDLCRAANYLEMKVSSNLYYKCLDPNKRYDE